MEGWTTTKLGNVAALIVHGIAPKYVEKGGILVVNQGCVRGHRIDLSEARRHDTTTKPVNHERQLRLGDVLVNSTEVYRHAIGLVSMAGLPVRREPWRVRSVEGGIGARRCAHPRRLEPCP